MWTYEQISGNMKDALGTLRGIGYSGAPPFGKNNPSLQNVKDVGPIPCGTYQLTEPFDSTDHGPYVMGLLPASENEMFGRSGFLLHGDSMEHPGQASKGCIVMPKVIRESIWQSGDHALQVVSGLEPTLEAT